MRYERTLQNYKTLGVSHSCFLPDGDRLLYYLINQNQFLSLCRVTSANCIGWLEPYILLVRYERTLQNYKTLGVSHSCFLPDGDRLLYYLINQNQFLSLCKVTSANCIGWLEPYILLVRYERTLQNYKTLGVSHSCFLPDGDRLLYYLINQNQFLSLCKVTSANCIGWLEPYILLVRFASATHHMIYFER